MKIDKNTWHYKLYYWTYKIWGSEWRTEVDQTNLCHYVQRIIWLTPFSALCYIVFSAGYLLATPFAFLFGGRPINIWTERNNERAWAPYPGLKVYGEVRVHPWVVAVPAALIYLEWLWWHRCYWMYPCFIQLAVLLVIGVLIGCGMYGASDSRLVINNWITAKKQGVCPLVEFVAEESDTKSDE